VAQLNIDPERSILLAVEAVKLAQQPGIDPVLPQASDALRQALEKARLNQPPLTAHSGVVNTAAFSPDGHYFVTSSNDGTAIIWEAATGKAMQTLKGHTEWVTRATFSPDGHYVVTVSNDSTVRVWEVQTGKELVNISGQPPGKGISNVAAFNSAVFSPDGRYILTASLDNTGKVWEVNPADSTGQEVATLRGHSARIIQATFSPDGRYIVTAASDNRAS
jgi:WD40 repeat protein